MNFKLYSLMCVCGILTACVQNPPKPDIVRICDERGCANRHRDYARFDHPNAVQNTEEPWVTELKTMAETDPRAAYDLGLRYFRGDKVTQNSYQALTWMRKAAERGHLKAQKALGRFYLTGLEEMGSDPREAEKWLSLAVGQGDTESAMLLEEATEAKKSEATEYKWRQHWHTVFYNEWYVGYTYLCRFENGVWYYID